ncbi:MAG: putative zinc-binding peptidase [Verrucomicrobiae bacterium]|nr:putative zinc-binding peptidase [Verrucomicrobiae bacterium]MCP5542663.1 putative zinc-binding peptidase [Akkermansiaceae bacterium]
MKLFRCPSCDNTVFFENDRCLHCGSELAYFPETGRFTSIEAAGGDDAGRPLFREGGEAEATHRMCANRVEHAACNWMVPADDPLPFCRSCRLNRTIPNLLEAGSREAWMRIESAKRRFVRTLLDLGLPLESKTENPGDGIAFDFLRDSWGAPPVMTGHDNGLITINLGEADDIERTRARVELDERYRTLLGHFRHESGHYYWDKLVRGGPLLGEFRALFGDERTDYASALSAYYANGPRPDWMAGYVSAYASSHPWEDWAETWAHYLHTVDALETADSFGMTLAPRTPEGGGIASLALTPRPDGGRTFDDMMRSWVSLTVALNSFNRALGMPDPYPFALTPGSIAKLRFVHETIRASTTE